MRVAWMKVVLLKDQIKNDQMLSMKQRKRMISKYEGQKKVQTRYKVVCKGRELCRGIVLFVVVGFEVLAQ